MSTGENKTIEYFCCRYSLFKEEQIHINDILSPKTKEESFILFIRELEKRIKLELSCGKDSFILYFIGQISDMKYLLKFAKKVKRTINQPTGTDIEQMPLEDYPWCSIIVDIDQQRFLISKNNEITTDISTLKNHIAKAISKRLNEVQISLQLELLTDKKSFWESIHYNEGEIQYVELTLISPNYLGQSYSTTKMLKEMKGEINNDSVIMKFTNERGKLKVLPNNHFFTDMLEYIANGCGCWKIKSKSQRKVIKSEQQAIMYPLDKDIYTLTSSQKEDIRSAFAHLDSIEKENHKKE